MYKKARCTCRVVVLLIQPIAFLTFSLSSSSWHLKVPSFMQLRYLRPSLTSPYVNEESGFWNPGNVCLWNPESWASDSRIQLKNSESHLESRIQVPLTNAGIEYLESGIRGVDSRIQDCLTVGRSTSLKRKDEPLPPRNIDWKAKREGQYMWA